ncbi:unnamed protein product [Rotaria sp. Silwood1]|nr:unnamed protein product [Rotaria sp. Silwood1]
MMFSFSCGCYGSKSCTLNGTLCNYDQTNDSCLCDCCPPCNTCQQFLEFSCLANRYTKHYSLSNNQSNIILKINTPMKPQYIIDQTNNDIVQYLWDPCLRRALPNGIYLKNDNNGIYKLIGIPREKLEKTSFEILFKGSVNRILLVNFTITII